MIKNYIGIPANGKKYKYYSISKNDILNYTDQAIKLLSRLQQSGCVLDDKFIRIMSDPDNIQEMDNTYGQYFPKSYEAFIKLLKEFY